MVKFFYRVILFLVQKRQILNMLGRAAQLLLQVGDLPLLVVQNQELGIHILCRDVADLGCSGRVLQSGQVFFKESI